MLTRLVVFVSFLTFSLAVQAQHSVIVGGGTMTPSKNIVENAISSQDHTTLVAAVQAADLVETLQTPGPFTVFAPTNSAFAELPDGTVETLLKAENKATLTKVLTYHVVAGTFNYDAIAKAIRANNGSATLKTVSGDLLTAQMNGPRNIVVIDAQGNVANVTTYDVNQENGIIHVVDGVLLP